MSDDIEYISYPKNFGMMIPKEAYKPPKRSFIKIGKEYGYWSIKIRIPRYPKLLDKLLRPLCKLDWHRWTGGYGFKSYKIAEENGHTRQWELNNETHTKCARCGKTKIITHEKK